MHAWIINDEEYDQQATEEIVLEQFPDAIVKKFWELPMDMGHVDLIIIDISSVCSIMMLHAAYSPICTMLDRHPGATVIIMSNISRECAAGIIEDCQERIPDSDIRLAPYPCFSNLAEVLRTL